MRVIYQLRVRNFEALKKFDVDLGGVTVIVGETNSGKSSIVRALKKVLYNDRGVPEITHGESSCSIGIDYNGHQVTWKRTGDGSIVYKLDDKTYHRASDTPQPIKDVLGLVEVGNGVRVNLSEQFKSLFLINMTGSQLADMIGCLFDLEKANKLMEILSKELRDFKKRGEVLSDEKDSLVKPDTERIDFLEKNINKYYSASEDKRELGEDLEKLLELIGKKKVFNKVDKLHKNFNMDDLDTSRISGIDKLMRGKNSLESLRNHYVQMMDELKEEMALGICPIAQRPYYKGCLKVLEDSNE